MFDLCFVELRCCEDTSETIQEFRNRIDNVNDDGFQRRKKNAPKIEHK